MGCTRQQLTAFLDDLLEPHRFRDYCPNGLQVEGRSDIGHLVTGVTASQALIDAALKRGADAILVHHGYFWRSEDPCIVGIKAQRIRSLIANDVNLFAYHLPLDWHPQLGNNATLGRLMGLEDAHPMDPSDTDTPIFVGHFPTPVPISQLAQVLQERLAREPMLIGEQAVSSVAWCTGAGQGYIDAAADWGADVFVTGEVSEQTVHIARERGIGFIAAGHHATERYGVQAVGERVAGELGISHEFIDVANPA